VSLRYPASVALHRASESKYLIANVEVTRENNRAVSRTAVFKGELLSTAPYFEHSGHIIWKDANTMVPAADTTITTALKTPDTVFPSDIRHMASEVTKAEAAEALRDYANSLLLHGSVSIDEFKRHPCCSADVLDSCDFFRIEREAQLRSLFGAKQGGRLRALTLERLGALEDMLATRPWLLCFNRWASLFQLAPLKFPRFIDLVRDQKIPVGTLEYMAARTIHRIRWLRKHNGHTLFRRDEAIEITEPEMRHQVYAFLQYRAIKWLDDTGTFCLLEDYANDNMILDGLIRICGTQGHSQRRLGRVPCVASQDLTRGQRAFVRHLPNSHLALLQGGPGTGKSEVGLVWLLQHFRAPQIVTYTGMMVNAGQARMGQRRETMRTIHYVIHAVRHIGDMAREWLSQFDCLVIDEASNVDSELLATLMQTLEGCPIKKLVMLGDLGQLYPISPGCPFADLVRFFPLHSFVLTENKRVEAEALQLVSCSTLIQEGRSREIDFTQNPDVLAIHPRSDPLIQAILERWVTTLPDLMQMHMVVLRNVDRRRLNVLVETWLLERNLMSRKPSLRVSATCVLYRGQKVCFTKNISPPVGDPVYNGELAQVDSFKTNYSTGTMTVTMTSGKVVVLNANSDLGVPPQYMDLGYAVTCNKAQGSEWQRVLFYIHEGAGDQVWWTRAHPYVATSRARMQCAIIGDEAELHAICGRVQRPRDTVLSYLLERNRDRFQWDQVEEGQEEEEEQEPLLLPKSTPAVPLMSSETKKKKKKKL
jgi:hypothetical protein